MSTDRTTRRPADLGACALSGAPSEQESIMTPSPPARVPRRRSRLAGPVFLACVLAGLGFVFSAMRPAPVEVSPASVAAVPANPTGSAAPLAAANVSPHAGSESAALATRNIEDLRPGDMVLGRDESNPDGPLVEMAVEAIHVRLSDHLRLLAIVDDAGEAQIIRTTDEHLFWLLTPLRRHVQLADGMWTTTAAGSWTRAADLQAGDELLSPDGQPLYVAATAYEPYPNGIPVYNLTIGGGHTYFVASDTSPRGPPVWVHNKGRAPKKLTKAESPQWQQAKSYRGKTRTNGQNGKAREYYEWDNTHGDIEVYDSRGNHLGTKDPTTGKMVKPAVPGRRIDL